MRSAVEGFRDELAVAVAWFVRLVKEFGQRTGFGVSGAFSVPGT